MSRAVLAQAWLWEYRDRKHCLVFNIFLCHLSLLHFLLFNFSLPSTLLWALTWKTSISCSQAVPTEMIASKVLGHAETPERIANWKCEVSFPWLVPVLRPGKDRKCSSTKRVSVAWGVLQRNDPLCCCYFTDQGITNLFVLHILIQNSWGFVHPDIKEVLIGSSEICVRSERRIYWKRADGLVGNFPRRLQLFKNGRN